MTPRHQNPGASVATAFAAQVSDGERGLHTVLREPAQYREQIEILAGDMDGQDPVRCEVRSVDLEALACQQVHGYGIAVEGVDCEHIEALRRSILELSLHENASIAYLHVDVRTARPCVGESPRTRASRQA